MPEENEQVSGIDIGRWLILALFLVGCLVAYFAFAPKVPPVIMPYVTSNPS